MQTDSLAARNGAEILENDLKARKLEQLHVLLQDIKRESNKLVAWSDTAQVQGIARVIRQLAVDGIEVAGGAR